MPFFDRIFRINKPDHTFVQFHDYQNSKCSEIKLKLEPLEGVVHEFGVPVKTISNIIIPDFHAVNNFV